MPSYNVTVPSPTKIVITVEEGPFTATMTINLLHPTDPVLDFKFNMRLLYQVKDINFYLGSAVLLPVDRVDGEVFSSSDDGDNVFTRLAEAMVVPLYLNSIKLFITGHTDTSYDSDINNPLSLARARGVYNLMLGKKEDWIADITENENKKWKKVKDYQFILHWLVDKLNWDCDPGPINGELNSATKMAIKKFKIRFNKEFGEYEDNNNPGKLKVNDEPDKEMWKAIYYLYERAFRAKLCGVELEELSDYDTTETSELLLDATGLAIVSVILSGLSKGLNRAASIYKGPHQKVGRAVFSKLEKWMASTSSKLKKLPKKILTSGLRPSVAALNFMRDQVSDNFLSTPMVGCGEKYPIEKPEQDDLISATNRRVEINYFLKEFDWDHNSCSSAIKELPLPDLLGLKSALSRLRIKNINFSMANPHMSCSGCSCAVSKGACPLYDAEIEPIEIKSGVIPIPTILIKERLYTLPYGPFIAKLIIDMFDPINPDVELEISLRLFSRIEDINFHLGSAILLPANKLDGETFIINDDDNDVFSRLAMAMLIPMYFESISLFIAGHTDTLAKPEINNPLSLARANQVYNLMLGKKDEWLADILENENKKWQKIKDYQFILHWVAHKYGWDCQPGLVDGDLGPSTKKAIKQFKTIFNTEFGEYKDDNNPGKIEVNDKADKNMWEAIYYLFERALRARICKEEIGELKDYDENEEFVVKLDALGSKAASFLATGISRGLEVVSKKYNGRYMELGKKIFNGISSWFKSTSSTFNDVFEKINSSEMRPSYAVLSYVRERISDDFFKTPAVGCGEKHPIQDKDLDEHECATNRRVDINLFPKELNWKIPSGDSIMKDVSLPGALKLAQKLASVAINNVKFTLKQPDLSCSGSCPSCSVAKGDCPLYDKDYHDIEIDPEIIPPPAFLIKQRIFDLSYGPIIAKIILDLWEPAPPPIEMDIHLRIMSQIDHMNFNTKSSMLLPAPRINEDSLELNYSKPKSFTRLTLAMLFPLYFESIKLFISGHADSRAGEDLNDPLSFARAQQVYQLLAGEKDKWLDARKSKWKSDDDHLVVLSWIADELLWDCKPIKATNSKEMVEKFKVAFNEEYADYDDLNNPGKIEEDDKHDDEFWKAVYYLYELALRATMCKIPLIELKSYDSKKGIQLKLSAAGSEGVGFLANGISLGLNKAMSKFKGKYTDLAKKLFDGVGSWFDQTAETMEDISQEITESGLRPSAAVLNYVRKRLTDNFIAIPVAGCGEKNLIFKDEDKTIEDLDASRRVEISFFLDDFKKEIDAGKAIEGAVPWPKVVSAIPKYAGINLDKIKLSITRPELVCKESCPSCDLEQGTCELFQKEKVHTITIPDNLPPPAFLIRNFAIELPYGPFLGNLTLDLWNPTPPPVNLEMSLRIVSKIEDMNFNTASSMLLPAQRIDQNRFELNYDEPKSFSRLTMAMLFPLYFESIKLFISGHADSRGDEKKTNEPLSLARAKQIYQLMAGEKDQWLKAIKDGDWISSDDHLIVLSWVADELFWDCKPKSKADSKEMVKNFKVAFNAEYADYKDFNNPGKIDENDKQDDEFWTAVYYLYELALRATMCKIPLIELKSYDSKTDIQLKLSAAGSQGAGFLAGGISLGLNKALAKFKGNGKFVELARKLFDGVGSWFKQTAETMEEISKEITESGLRPSAAVLTYVRKRLTDNFVSVPVAGCGEKNLIYKDDAKTEENLAASRRVEISFFFKDFKKEIDAGKAIKDAVPWPKAVSAVTKLAGMSIDKINIAVTHPELSCKEGCPSCDLESGQCKLYNDDDIHTIELSDKLPPPAFLIRDFAIELPYGPFLAKMALDLWEPVPPPVDLDIHLRIMSKIDHMNFNTKSSMLLPAPRINEDSLEFNYSKPKSFTRLTLAMLFPLYFESIKLFISGHADSRAGEDLNDPLSFARAQQVYQLLAGEKDKWLDTRKSKWKSDDDHLIVLSWIADELLWDCKPIQATDSKEMVKNFKVAFNEEYADYDDLNNPGKIDENDKHDDEFWKAVYYLYEQALRATMCKIPLIELKSYDSKKGIQLKLSAAGSEGVGFLANGISLGLNKAMSKFKGKYTDLAKKLFDGVGSWFDQTAETMEDISQEITDSGLRPSAAILNYVRKRLTDNFIAIPVAGCGEKNLIFKDEDKTIEDLDASRRVEISFFLDDFKKEIDAGKAIEGAVPWPKVVKAIPKYAGINLDKIKLSITRPELVCKESCPSCDLEQGTCELFQKEKVHTITIPDNLPPPAFLIRNFAIELPYGPFIAQMALDLWEPVPPPVDLKMNIRLLSNIEDIHFHLGSAILLPANRPNGDSFVIDKSDTPDSFSRLAEALTIPLYFESINVFIAGHTDTTGGHDVNNPLSLARADQIHNLMMGHKDKWISGIRENRWLKDKDYLFILFWAAEKLGWDCNTNEKTDPKEAIKNFKIAFNKEFSEYNDENNPGKIQENQEADEELWLAIYYLYERALRAKLCGVPFAGLKEYDTSDTTDVSLDASGVGIASHLLASLASGLNDVGKNYKGPFSDLGKGLFGGLGKWFDASSSTLKDISENIMTSGLRPSAAVLKYVRERVSDDFLPTPAVGCGQRHVLEGPVDEPFDSPLNRRVEINFFPKELNWKIPAGETIKDLVPWPKAISALTKITGVNLNEVNISLENPKLECKGDCPSCNIETGQCPLYDTEIHKINIPPGLIKLPTILLKEMPFRLPSGPFNIELIIDTTEPLKSRLTFTMNLRFYHKVKDINYNFESAVILPNDDIFSLLSQTLIFPMLFKNIKMLINGHTDTSGPDTINNEISLLRSTGVLNLLLGDKDGWIANLTNPAMPGHKWKKTKDYQMILAWAAKEMGWHCHPGLISEKLDDNTKKAIYEFKCAFNKEFGTYEDMNNPGELPEDNKADVKMWEAIYYLYERAIRAELTGQSLANLKKLDVDNSIANKITALSTKYGAKVIKDISGAITSAGKNYKGAYPSLAKALYSSLGSTFGASGDMLKGISSGVKSGLRRSAALLATAREGIQNSFLIPAKAVGCGERYPIKDEELKDHRCPENRRVEINYFPKAWDTELKADDPLFKGTDIFSKLEQDGINGLLAAIGSFGISKIDVNLLTPELSCANTCPSCTIEEKKCPFYDSKIFTMAVSAGAVELQVSEI